MPEQTTDSAILSFYSAGAQAGQVTSGYEIWQAVELIVENVTKK